jgi:hypothetical protein
MKEQQHTSSITERNTATGFSTRTADSLSEDDERPIVPFVIVPSQWTAPAFGSVVVRWLGVAKHYILMQS